MKREGLFTRVRRVGRLRSGVVASVAILATDWTAAAAWAQKQSGLPDDENTLIRWGIAAGIAIIIGLPAFLNSKRSHLT